MYYSVGDFVDLTKKKEPVPEPKETLYQVGTRVVFIAVSSVKQVLDVKYSNGNMLST